MEQGGVIGLVVGGVVVLANLDNADARMVRGSPACWRGCRWHRPARIPRAP